VPFCTKVLTEEYNSFLRCNIHQSNSPFDLNCCLIKGNLRDKAVQQQIASLNQQNGGLCTHIQTLTANQPHLGPLKTNFPKEFSGACLEAHSFLMQCKLAFHANQNNLTSDDAMVAYGASYLHKDIFLWYQITLLISWEAWAKTNREQTAKDKLKHMKQKGT
jgi:hypothetical protein